MHIYLQKPLQMNVNFIHFYIQIKNSLSCFRVELWHPKLDNEFYAKTNDKLYLRECHIKYENHIHNDFGMAIEGFAKWAVKQNYFNIM